MPLAALSLVPNFCEEYKKSRFSHSSPDPLFKGLLYGNSDDVNKTIVDRRINVNALYNNSAPYWFYGLCRIDNRHAAKVTKLVFDRVDDIDALDNSNHSALHWALHSDNKVFLNELLWRNATVSPELAAKLNALWDWSDVVVYFKSIKQYSGITKWGLEH